jgi:phenylacetate-CoA ligase
MTPHPQPTWPAHGVLDAQAWRGPGSSNLSVVLRVLGRRHRLRQRDQWTREQLQAYQARALRQLREHAYTHSPFYRRLHAGRTDRPLHELPVLTKAMVMEHLDELVTDPTVKLADVEAHLAALQGNERFRGRYWVAATSGTTGRRGIFLWDLDEWVAVLASYNRSLEWAGVTAGLTRRLRMAVVSSTIPWHQSARVGASVRSPWVQTLRIDSGDPLEGILKRLDRFQPQVLVGYASMLRLLASEQLAGRLTIAPEVVFSASEVLTGETRRRIQQAWGRRPFDVYAATETAGIAAECQVQRGLHLFEDLVVTEVADSHDQPVPPGVSGEKVLVSVLFSRTQPLIRYELSDSITPSTRLRCPCGRPLLSSRASRGASRKPWPSQPGQGARSRCSRRWFTASWTRCRPRAGSWSRSQSGWPCCSPASRIPLTRTAWPTGSGASCGREGRYRRRFKCSGCGRSPAPRWERLRSAREGPDD